MHTIKLIVSIVLLGIFFFSEKVEAETVLTNPVLEYLSAEYHKCELELMKEKPLTVTASSCKRSFGGKHDFYSEGDYWWPDPANPTGPYIQKDGQTNPMNFVDHRLAMIRSSEITATLTSEWLLTKDQKYVNQILKHFKAWFVNPST